MGLLVEAVLVRGDVDGVFAALRSAFGQQCTVLGRPLPHGWSVWRPSGVSLRELARCAGQVAPTVELSSFYDPYLTLHRGGGRVAGWSTDPKASAFGNELHGVPTTAAGEPLSDAWREHLGGAPDGASVESLLGSLGIAMADVWMDLPTAFAACVPFSTPCEVGEAPVFDEEGPGLDLFDGMARREGDVVEVDLIHAGAAVHHLTVEAWVGGRGRPVEGVVVEGARRAAGVVPWGRAGGGPLRVGRASGPAAGARAAAGGEAARRRPRRARAPRGSTGRALRGPLVGHRKLTACTSARCSSPADLCGPLRTSVVKPGR